MTNWKSATCEKCVFCCQCADGTMECRRFPPLEESYPTVSMHDVNTLGDVLFIDACAEYTEEGQLPLKQIGDIPTAPFTTYDVAEEAWKAQ